VIDFAFRTAQCRDYLAALEAIRFGNWQVLFDARMRQDLGLAATLALVHPDVYSHRDGAEMVRGARIFAREAPRQKCGAVLCWGYECDRPADCADHLFPYSLGGPTVSANKLYLCWLHNQMKSNDAHCYPWERGEPSWLQSTLARIVNLRT
jgi:hypothetical protein